MENIHPILDQSITIEFFVGGDKKIHVVMNGHNYRFMDFWTEVPNAENISQYMLQEFKYQYPERYRAAHDGSRNWQETFIKIINSHLRLYDDKLDVFIHQNGEITFNLEI